MFWKGSKKPPKESSSRAFVRQDSRTTVETNTVQSETSSTSMYSDTIFNENNNTVAFRTTTRTITHQQQACVTEINKRYTPTPEELAEMRAAIFTKTETTTSRSSNGKSGRNVTQLLAIKNNMPKHYNNNHNKSPLSPLVFTFDSPPHCYSTSTKSTTTSTGSGGTRKPTTPTIVKIEKTDVTQTNGTSVTSRVEQQRIKIGGNNAKTFHYSTAHSPQLNTRRLHDATNIITPNKVTSHNVTKQMFQLSSPNSPLTTKQFNSEGEMKGFAPRSCTYQSPYLNRSIYTPTSSPVITSTASDKEKAVTIKSKLNDLNWPRSSLSTSVPVKTTINPLNNNNLKITPSSDLIGTSTKLASKPKLITGGSRKQSKLLPGHVYIFNNEIFDNPTNEYRVGSSADVRLLRTTFDSFKMKVHLIENATLEKIDSTVKKIENKDFSQHSCLVIVILSHGARREAVSAKDGSYSIDDKILFPVLRNRTLIDKPKIMFIQACKGAMESEGFVHTDSVQPHGSPDEILKCYSTFEGYVAYRSENGSIFIQTVCEFLKLFGEIKNITDIMEMVKLRVKQKSNGKQIPAIMSTLTQPYVFGDYF